MTTPLRVLIVDDSDDDALLLVQALQHGPWQVAHERVDTPEAMAGALARQPWEVIIADYSMPHFSGPAALAQAMQHSPGVPFILVSGVAGEEIAVQAMKSGADDYFSKGNLVRLVPAVTRELQKAEARRKARAVEKQLRERELHLADALRLAHVGTWHLNMGTTTAVWSEEACRISGFSPDQSPPSFEEWLNRLYPKDRIAIAELLRDPLKKQFAYDAQMIRTDGTAQFINIRGDVIRNADSVVTEAAGTIQDITPRKLAEVEIERTHVQLLRQNQRLIALSEQAHRFVDDVSHEFRTPLAVIKEFSAIIADGLAGPVTRQQKQYIEILDNAVIDLNQMVEDFLDSSKLRAGRLRVDRRPQSIHAIFTRIRPGLTKKAASRSITVAERIEPGLPMIFADEEKVRRVIMNLLTNAIKFSPEGSQIELWARQAGDGGVEVGVTDNGRGLTPADQQQLFERFRQLPNSDGPSAKGFGLGLNIARRLVWLNLGRMNVVSELGKGSTFSFVLSTDDPYMIVDRFFLRLAECEELTPAVSVLMITANSQEESHDSLRRFLAAATRPTDVILEMTPPSKGFLLLGPTQAAEGWAARLARVRDNGEADAGCKVGPLRTTILGTYVYPAEASDAAACALQHLTQEVANA